MLRWTLLFALGALASPLTALADPVADAGASVTDPAEKAAKSQPAASFVAMPVPLVSPAIGNGLGLAAIAITVPGDSPKPWTTGVGGLYTDNGTWAALAFQKAYLFEDHLRITAAGGGGVFNVKYYGTGQAAGARGVSIDLEQDAVGGVGDVLFRVSGHTFAGLRYRGARIDTKVDLPTPPVFPDLILPDLELKSAISQLGLSVEYDSRDNEYNPNSGILADAQWLVADEALGSDFDYDLLNAAVNGYHRIDDKSLLAWRGSLCHAGDGAPFYDICNFGAKNDLRGYPGGQFRDRAMFALQAEYRRKLFWRVGAVAFAGVGEVAPQFQKMSSGDLLPAAGVGLRFEASKTYHVNASIDFAVGKDVSATYFYIGEAF